MHAMLRQIEAGGAEGDVRNQASELTGPVIQGVFTLAAKYESIYFYNSV